MWRKLVAFAILSATAIAADEKWIKVTSPNFELYTPAGERTARSAIQYFEKVRSFFLQATGMEPKEKKRIRLVGFRSEREFQRFDEYSWAAAFYQPGADHDYIVMKSLSDQIYTVAVHEYVHLLVRHSGMKLPTWLNEGLAEFYSTLKPVGKQVKVGEFDLGRYQMLMNNKWLPMEELVSASRDSAYRDEKNRVSVFYSQSWALTHMVVMEDDYRPKAQKFMQAIQAQPAVDAFRGVYGKSMKNVTDDLNGYMRGNRYKVLVVNAPLSKLAETPETQPITGPEADLVLARVLMNSGKYTAARELLKDTGEASGAEHNEVLGYLHLYEKDDAKATEHLSRAAAAGSRTLRLYKDLANLLWRAGSHDQAVSALRQGLTLDPSDNGGRLWLGSMLVSRRRYGEAMSELVQAKRLDPELASRYYRMLAQTYVGLKAWPQARESAVVAVKHAKTDPDRDGAARLIDYLDKRAEWEKMSKVAAEAAANTAIRQDAPTALLEEAAAGSDETPTLRRRPQTAEEDEAPFEIVRGPLVARGEGTFEKVECAESGARFHFVIGGAPLVLTVDDPNLVTIAGRGAAEVELTCGPQKSAVVEIGWITDGAPAGTAGLLRRLAFR